MGGLILDEMVKGEKLCSYIRCVVFVSKISVSYEVDALTTVWPPYRIVIYRGIIIVYYTLGSECFALIVGVLCFWL